MGRTTRICSLVLLAGIVWPVQAKRLEPTPLNLYVRARAADGERDAYAAIASYRKALEASPDSPNIAFRAYRGAIQAGDFVLALKAAHTLDQRGILPPDAKILLYVDAVRNRDWERATIMLKRVASESGFSFLAPLLADWLALGTGSPIVDLPKPKSLEAMNAYIGESRALQQVARGQHVDGLVSVRALWSLDPYRARSLRIAAASTLADQGKREAAESLLVGDDRSTIAAKARIAKGKPLSTSVDTPAKGTAFLLARMAGDLIEERSSRSAITIAQLATYADPANPRIALTAAGALAAAKRPVEALTIADRVRKDPIYGDDAQSLHIDLLEALGRTDEALAEARSRAGRSVNDLSRLGDIEARRGNHADAVKHYEAAIAAIGDDKVDATLWHAAGNAYDLAGNWPAARKALERAVALAPDNAAVLNELGYGLIDRGEETDRASMMIMKASTLLPDSAEIADSVGWAAFRRGRIDSAIAVLERAMRLDNGEAEIGEHLGDAYWTAGRKIDARYAWRAAREIAEGDAITRLEAKIDRGLP